MRIQQYTKYTQVWLDQPKEPKNKICLLASLFSFLAEVQK